MKTSIGYIPKGIIASTAVHKPDKHSETMDRISAIIEKAALYEVKGLIFSLHKNAECNLSVEEALVNVTETLTEIERIAAGYGVKVYVQILLYNSKWASQCRGLFFCSLSCNIDFIVLYADYKN